MLKKSNIFLIMVLMLATHLSACQSARPKQDNLEKTGNDPENIWFSIAPSSISQDLDEKSLPNKYLLLTLNMAKVKKRLASLESEEKSTNKIRLEKDANDFVYLHIPWDDGSFVNFKIKNSTIFSPELARKFPDIRSYSGEKQDDQTTHIRLDINPSGLYAMITSPEKTIFIRPKERKSKIYLCYNKADVNQDNREFNEPPIKSPKNN